MRSFGHLNGEGRWGRWFSPPARAIADLRTTRAGQPSSEERASDNPDNLGAIRSAGQPSSVHHSATGAKAGNFPLPSTVGRNWTQADANRTQSRTQILPLETP